MKMTLMSAPSMLMTSESVTEGHPDKLCDQIADAILDEILACDPMAHVACEVTATTGLVVIIGEITTVHHVDYTKIARETIRRVGYTSPEYGFDADSCGIVTSTKTQSPATANGGVHSKALGDDVELHVVRPVLGAWMEGLTSETIHVNTSGSFVLGGPAGDSGLSGRKNIVDSYGSGARHGGGAYSGKEPTKGDPWPPPSRRSVPRRSTMSSSTGWSASTSTCGPTLSSAT